jgi:hypothetical protein
VFIIYFIYDITFGFTGSPFVMKQNDCFNHTYGLLSVAVLALPAFPKTWASGIDFIILS